MSVLVGEKCNYYKARRWKTVEKDWYRVY